MGPGMVLCLLEVVLVPVERMSSHPRDFKHAPTRYNGLPPAGLFSQAMLYSVLDDRYHIPEVATLVARDLFTGTAARHRHLGACGGAISN